MNKTNSEIIAEAVEEYYKKLLPNENAKGLADIKRFHLSNMMGDTISIMNIIIDKARASGREDAVLKNRTIRSSFLKVIKEMELYDTEQSHDFNRGVGFAKAEILRKLRLRK